MAGTIVANTLNTDTGLFSTNNAYTGIAKAWVNFNGVTTPSIRASFNVSSITRTAAGTYTINYATAMPDANYSIAGTAQPNGDGRGGLTVNYNVTPPVTTTAAYIQTLSVSGLQAATDSAYVFVMVIGN
jgi:hypothetical protein